MRLAGQLTGRLLLSAEGGSRTRTGVCPQSPEPCASASSATSASLFVLLFPIEGVLYVFIGKNSSYYDPVNRLVVLFERYLFKQLELITHSNRITLWNT